MAALEAHISGARGAVIYGASRDLDTIKEMKDFPVFAEGFHPNPSKQTGVDWNAPIRVGRTTVLPGDVVVAEEEAVLFFPPQLAAEVIASAKGVAASEERHRQELLEKKDQPAD